MSGINGGIITPYLNHNYQIQNKIGLIIKSTRKINPIDLARFIMV
jgi:hypothetical protein